MKYDRSGQAVLGTWLCRAAVDGNMVRKFGFRCPPSLPVRHVGCIASLQDLGADLMRRNHPQGASLQLKAINSDTDRADNGFSAVCFRVRYLVSTFSLPFPKRHGDDPLWECAWVFTTSAPIFVSQISLARAPKFNLLLIPRQTRHRIAAFASTRGRLCSCQSRRPTLPNPPVRYR